MPSLRYGRDITDDAAQLLRLRDEAVAQVRDTALSPDVRDRARERLRDINELVRNAYGNIRTVRLFASEAGEYDGTYTSEGRGAAGLQNTVQTRPALGKAAHAAMKRLEKQGRIPKITIYDENDKESPINIGRARPTSLTPRMQAGRQASRERGGRRLLAEAAGPRKVGKPRKEVATAKDIGSAARAVESRLNREAKSAAKKANAPKKATPPKKAAKKTAKKATQPAKRANQRRR